MLSSFLLWLASLHFIIASNAFETIWYFGTSGTVTLPFRGSFNINVEWGDGNFNNYTSSSNSLSHNFPTPFTATISITILSMSNFGFVGVCPPELRSITKWGNFTFDASSAGAFANCANLVIDASDQPLFSDDRPTLAGVFSGCTSLASVQGLNWDLMDKVVSLEEMFAGNLHMDFPVTFSGTNNILSMKKMFENAKVFNSPLLFESTANVTDMSRMFYDAAQFNQVVNFDTKNVLSMERMFHGARQFNRSLNFNTAKARTFAHMFHDATNFDSEFNFSDVSQVTDMSAMFESASNFNKPINFSSSANVISLSTMFAGATKFNSPLLLNTTKVSDLEGMFMGAAEFNMPLLFDTQSVTNIVNLFSDAHNFRQDLRSWNLYGFTECLICQYCGLPEFYEPSCNPCGSQTQYRTYKSTNWKMCACWPGNETDCVAWESYAPSSSPTTSSPTTSVPTLTAGPTTGPTTAQPTVELTSQPSSHVTLQPTLQITSQPSQPSPSPSPSNTVRVPIANATTTFNASGGVQVTIPGVLGNGTVEVTVNQSTSRTVTPVVTIVFFDPFDREKNVSNLTTPVRFVLPLLPAALTSMQLCMHDDPVFVVPACNWFDTISRQWTTSGCMSNLTRTEVQCSCTHLTDFAAVFPLGNQVPLPKLLDLDMDNITRYPDGLMTVGVVLAMFAVVVMFSIQRDIQAQKHEEELRMRKIEKWKQAESNLWHMTRARRIWKQFKAGMQMRHTWASLFFRKSGVSFRSVDRAFVNLFLVLILMSVSAQFHDRHRDFQKRGVVMIYSLLASFLPSLVLIHLFTHTGEMGFQEKYQLENKLRAPSRLKCLNWRYPECCRYVWYAIVLALAALMIVFILTIALVFDQNPFYYCKGETTVAWLVDFISPYLISVFIVEPLKILFMVISKQLIVLPTTALATTDGTELGEDTQL